MRSFLLSDIIRRTLEYNDFKVRQVINITDVGHLTEDGLDLDQGEDKVEKAARSAGKSVKEITESYTTQFLEDLENLHIKTKDTTLPRATDYITEQLDLIKKLDEKGYVYETKDGLYFDISKFPPYAELGQLDLANQKPNTRHDMSTEKKHPADFALWKFSGNKDKRLQEWSSLWGVGFPGWHAECSAMSQDILGEQIDIHTGGEDHIPVHHSNERAVAESASGQKFVNYWLHNAFITVDNKKMSKSLGNFYILKDLQAKGFPALAYRYFILLGHYRTPLNFTLKALEAAKNSWVKINKELASLPDGGSVDEIFKQKFTEAINDDLNTPKALAVLHEVLQSKLSPADKKATIENFDQVFAILDLDKFKTINLEIPDEVEELLVARNLARKDKNWPLADDLRKQIEEAGFEIKDTDNDSILEKKY